MITPISPALPANSALENSVQSQVNRLSGELSWPAELWAVTCPRNWQVSTKVTTARVWMDAREISSRHNSCVVKISGVMLQDTVTKLSSNVSVITLVLVA